LKPAYIFKSHKFYLGHSIDKTQYILIKQMTGVKKRTDRPECDTLKALLLSTWSALNYLFTVLNMTDGPGLPTLPEWARDSRNSTQSPASRHTLPGRRLSPGMRRAQCYIMVAY